mmetsp:Transcript_88451/g.249264  ORF Transcript_88451/g.249264 Transcript_88451/m.249264 type:complete len:201 (+) Transcript_88451:1787-2389(+)
MPRNVLRVDGCLQADLQDLPHRGVAGSPGGHSRLSRAALGPLRCGLEAPAGGPESVRREGSRAWGRQSDPRQAPGAVPRMRARLSARPVAGPRQAVRRRAPARACKGASPRRGRAEPRAWPDSKEPREGPAGSSEGLARRDASPFPRISTAVGRRSAQQLRATCESPDLAGFGGGHRSAPGPARDEHPRRRIRRRLPSLA